MCCTHTDMDHEHQNGNDNSNTVRRVGAAKGKACTLHCKIIVQPTNSIKCDSVIQAMLAKSQFFSSKS